ncbi:FkbM family methyltransferase [Streptomyces mirabilis]
MKASRSCFACQRIDSPYYSVLAAHLVGPAGRVAAVEPPPNFHQMLTANARANGCDNVRAVNAAASDVPGRLVFYLERSTNLGGTTAVRPHTVESSFEADAAPLP